MVLPIVAYGHPALRNETEEIDANYPELQELIENMFKTMYNAHGVGLAAPQVGLSIRLFIVDGSPMAEDDEDDIKDFKRVFINPEIVDETGKPWGFEEGCLSIPDIREEVKRKSTITIRYFDEHFKEHEEVLDGMKARIVQHEYDHVEGVLFTDYISGFRKRIIRPRLSKISKGNITSTYPMKYSKNVKMM